MNISNRDRNKQLYGYVENLLAGNQYQSAVASCYNHLSQSQSYPNQKKIQWTIDLQKIMELFLDLAFITDKHSKIKQVLKFYRTVTQNQHPDSLKSILESYRDNKLQHILQQEIPKESINQIIQMGNIQDDEASSEIIISSFSSNTKNKREQIKANLSIVWEGYKAIIDTVRFNHKLQSVYRQTLRKIFEFVERYNRKHEFKSFCEYLRLGLKSVLNKRGDKNEQQKGFYIDIQKEQVNTNNIQIRFDQFDLAAKLGLWQQAFQILQDIKQIMKVRKGPVKNSLKCSYFERLSRIFKKSNYWHYHAYAFYNFYSIYITKSKLSISQKTKMADKLILSILCIPPSTLESCQSKQSQLKIASMMISGNKISDKLQLQKMMISKGVIESASNSIKQLWYFMFLDFDLTSLNKGLKLLQNIPQQDEYKQFIELLQEILIYKQLISVSELYQCIKFESLISIIPLPRDKIEKILLECNHRKVIDFIFDQKQGIIQFSHQFQQTNPYQQLLSCYVDVAILHEDSRKHDKQFIIKKTMDFMRTADNYYNNQRMYKIEEYKKKLKKPRQQLEQKQRQKERKLQQEKKNEELMKKQKQAQQRKQQQQRKKLFIQKKVRISQIIAAKQNRIVKVGNKKIENLTQQEVMQTDKQIFENLLTQVNTRVANDKSNRNKKKFFKIDYNERERRLILKQKLEQLFPGQNQQKNSFQKIKQFARIDHEEKQKLKAEIQNVAPEVKVKIELYYNQNKEKYQNNMIKFKESLTDQYKKKILSKARDLMKQAEQKKKQFEENRRKQQLKQNNQINFWIGSAPKKSDDDVWAIGSRKAPIVIPDQTNKNDILLNKKQIVGGTVKNTFADLKFNEDQKKQTKNQEIKIGKKFKIQQPSTQTQTSQKKEQKSAKFIPPPVQTPPSTQSKGLWGKITDNLSSTQPKGIWGKGTTDNVTTNKRQQPQFVFRPKKQEKKDDNKEQKKDDKKPKGRGW